MEYYIFYMNFEDKVMPIYCTGIGDDPLIEDHYLFTGVKHLDDKAFPALKVNAVSLPKSDIKYYLMGIEEEPAEIEEKEELPFEDDDFDSEEEESSEEPPPPPKLNRRRRMRSR